MKSVHVISLTAITVLTLRNLAMIIWTDLGGDKDTLNCHHDDQFNKGTDQTRK